MTTQSLICPRCGKHAMVVPVRYTIKALSCRYCHYYLVGTVAQIKAVAGKEKAS